MFAGQLHRKHCETDCKPLLSWAVRSLGEGGEPALAAGKVGGADAHVCAFFVVVLPSDGKRGQGTFVGFHTARAECSGRKEGCVGVLLCYNHRGREPLDKRHNLRVWARSRLLSVFFLGIDHPAKRGGNEDAAWRNNNENS